MKAEVRKTKTRTNGAVPNRGELLAAQERALKRIGKMSVREGFQSLVRAGIYTRSGKLTPRYGG